MKARERICSGCGKVSITCSKALRCNSCRAKDRATELIGKERARLEQDYEEVQGPSLDAHKHRTWTFVHLECGTRQTWSFSNLLKRWKEDPENKPCSKCGGQRRMKVAMDAFIEKYGRDFDVALWEEYSTKARRLTEKTYQKHKHEINPLNLKRGVHTYHLDHKMPIIDGFLQGIPAEQIAAKENLQILPAFDNLSKGRR